EVKRLLAAAALAAFLAALVAIAVGSATSGGGSSAASTTTRPTTAPHTTTQATTTATPKPRAVHLAAVGAYDPEGDQHENDSLAPAAADGSLATFWKTEHYTHGFFKKGVGLVLDTGARRKLQRVTVATDSPGARAQIELGDAPNGPFHAVSDDQPLAAS